MPNRYQWIIFIFTVIALLLEITNLGFVGGGIWGDSTRYYRIDSILLVALTVGVGFFLYRVAGKVKKKKSND